MDENSNLLDETITTIQKCGYKLEDVDYVCGNERWFTWNDFISVANIEYDCGYGGAEVAIDLRVVMKDESYFERAEYDGSEWWRYVKKLEKPNIYNPPKKLITGWCSDYLEDINREENE